MEHPHQASLHHEHGETHDSHAGGHEGMIADYKRRFFVSLGLTIPILILPDMIQEWAGFELTFPYEKETLFVLATIVYVHGGWPFLKGSIDELRQRNPGMMMLIGLAISVVYFYSVAIVFGYGHDFFWELATLIVIMLLGHWIEMRSILGASNTLQQLVRLLPSVAHRIKGSMTISTTSTGESTYLAKVIDLVKTAQESKSKTQNMILSTVIVAMNARTLKL